MSHRIWPAIVLGVLASFVAIGTGCRGRAATLDASNYERYTRLLVREAANDTGCPEGALTPQQIADAPPVFTVSGCAAPVEYWLECSRRCRWHRVPVLNEAASMPLQCPPQAIQQQPSQAPSTRMATGCGRSAAFTVACNGAACGWSQSSQVQMGSGPMMAQAGPGVPQQAGPSQGSSGTEIMIQQQVHQQREAILSCVDDPNLTLRLRWTAEGQIILQLPPSLAGTAAEGCINAVVGSIRVAANQPGEITVPVQ